MQLQQKQRLLCFHKDTQEKPLVQNCFAKIPLEQPKQKPRCIQFFTISETWKTNQCHLFISSHLSLMTWWKVASSEYPHCAVTYLQETAFLQEALCHTPSWWAEKWLLTGVSKRLSLLRHTLKVYLLIIHLFPQIKQHRALKMATPEHLANLFCSFYVLCSFIWYLQRDFITTVWKAMGGALCILPGQGELGNTTKNTKETTTINN